MNHKTLKTYGCPNEFDTQLRYDMWAFAWRIPAAGPRLQLFKKITDELVPGWFEWHEWTTRIVSALCERRWTGIPGCSNSAKTYNVTSFACVWWLCAPECSSAILCSTTMKMVRKRGWAEVQAFHKSISDRWGEVGNMLNSQTIWQYERGDDRNGIFALAVAEGDTNKAAANIQGIHTRRQFVKLDEAEAVPGGIWKASKNLYSYPVDNGGEFIMVAIANPRSRLSQMGRYIEPGGGWDSVSVETETWESKPQEDGKPALIVRLDFLKSPNVTAEVPVSKHIPTKRRVLERMDALKAKGAENDPDHWCYDRGFPPPEGLAKTVFTESLIQSKKGYERHQFTGAFFLIIGAFDPAFGGGDRPVLRFAALGSIMGGHLGIEWCPPIECYADASNKILPVRYQLRDQIKKHCASVKYRGQTYQCLPENLGIDCTGDGGLADIIHQDNTWPGANRVIRIIFSGACSELPISNSDSRPANKVYRNKRTEMYFRTRNALNSEQIRGIDKDTAEEMCQLEYSDMRDDGTMKPITIQDKQEYKLKYTKSPDYTDTGIMLTEVAQQKGFRVIEIGLEVEKANEFDQVVRLANQIHDENDLYREDSAGDDETPALYIS